MKLLEGLRPQRGGSSLWLLTMIVLLAQTETPSYPTSPLNYGDTVYIRHKDFGVTILSSEEDVLPQGKVKLYLMDELDEHTPFVIRNHNNENSESEVMFGDKILLQMSPNWVEMEDQFSALKLYMSTSGDQLQISAQHESSMEHVFTIAPSVSRPSWIEMEGKVLHNGQLMRLKRDSMVVSWNGDDNMLIFEDERERPVLAFHKIDEAFPAWPELEEGEHVTYDEMRQSHREQPHVHGTRDKILDLRENLVVTKTPGSFKLDDRVMAHWPGVEAGTKQSNEKFPGVIIGLHDDGSYDIEFDDGDVAEGVVESLISEEVDSGVPLEKADHSKQSFRVGDRVDAKWPADVLQNTELKDIYWPGIVKAVESNDDADSVGTVLYTILYDDGELSSAVREDWLRLELPCIDDNEFCNQLAKHGDCQSRPKVMYEQCRLSCKVCNLEVKQTEEEVETEFRLKSSELLWQKGNNVEAIGSLKGLLAENDLTDSVRGKALAILGEIYLHGFDEQRDLVVAKQYLEQSVALGNVRGQYNLGFMYSLAEDDPMSILHYYFAASGGSLEAQLTLGWRHLQAYGVPKSCETAVNYYKEVATAVIVDNQLALNLEMIRLSGDFRDSPLEEEEDRVQWFRNMAENGDVDAQLQLGKLYYYGGRGFRRNYEAAADYFQMAAAENDHNAMAFLGHMHIHGLGVSKNNETALKYLQLAVDKNVPFAWKTLGSLHLHGYAVAKDVEMAVKYLKKAADRGLPEAKYRLGTLYRKGVGVPQDFGQALSHFSSAAATGHGPALFQAAEMHNQGLGTARSCKMAVQIYKIVAEKAEFANIVQRARSYYLKGDYEHSLILYAKAAEMGFETAQLNAGWLLDRQLGWPDDASKALAYRYYLGASDQQNSNAQRIIGDYHFYGWLQQDSAKKDRFEEAARYYHLAAENAANPNPEATFNVGWMHHIGVGMSRDLELAKRYYDQSKTITPNSMVPSNVLLSILWLEKELSIVFPYKVMRWITAKLSEGADSYIKDETTVVSKDAISTSEANPDFSIIDILGLKKDRASLWTVENILLSVAVILLTVIVIYRQQDNLF